MKKLLTICLLLVSIGAMAQKSPWGFRTGVLVPVPVNVSHEYRMDMGSALASVSYKACKNLDVTLTSGFLRFQGSGANEDFTNIPALLGARYHVNKNVYFGVSAGPAFFNKEFSHDQRILYTPHIGYKTGPISVDANYFNWYDLDNKYNNIGLCVSYSLW